MFSQYHRYGFSSITPEVLRRFAAFCYKPGMVQVKICGLSDAGSVKAACDAGADFTGFVFYTRSPRYVSPGQAAQLIALVPNGIGKVGLFVDASDDAIAGVIDESAIDHLQLHGQETPDRVGAIRARFGLPVIKAVGIAGPSDIDTAMRYETLADMLLFDAKPPATASALPGGNGLVFDWNLIAAHGWTKPWMLSGGLNAENLSDAVRISGAKLVDVSSGVESAPGVKHIEKIRGFIKAAKRL